MANITQNKQGCINMLQFYLHSILNTCQQYLIPIETCTVLQKSNILFIFFFSTMFTIQNKNSNDIYRSDHERKGLCMWKVLSAITVNFPRLCLLKPGEFASVKLDGTMGLDWQVLGKREEQIPEVRPCVRTRELWTTNSRGNEASVNE